MYETYSQDRAHIPDIQTPAPHDTRTHTSIWAPTFWSSHSIPTEQNSEENQKDSAHETEIREYPIRLFYFCNNLICV